MPSPPPAACGSGGPPPGKQQRVGNDARKRRRIGKDARRRLIVHAALQVFAERGYHAASLDEIARRAGIRKPVLYDHFPSKADLHLSLLATQRDELLEHVRAELEGGVPSDDAVALALDAFFAWVQHHRYAWRMLFQESTGDAGVVERHRRIRETAHVAVVDLLLDQASEGPTSRQEREAIAALVGGGVNGLARWWYDHPRVPRSTLVALAMNVMWLGLERVRDGESWAR